MELHLVIEGSKDLSGQVYRQLADAIRSGRLADGQQVPPSRLLAQQLGISRKPVAEAYTRLTYDQLLVGRIGKGSFVCAPASTSTRRAAAPQLGGHATLQRWDGMQTPLRHPLPEGRSRYEFIGGSPSPQHFPQEEWRRCVLHGLREESRAPGLARYAPAEGLPELRDAIARHAGYARGVTGGAQQVVVTNGAQQAFDLLGKVLLEPGSVVAVEEPGYPLVRLLFASQGARVVGVPVDAEGMMVDRIPADARLVYVTPAHQFPLGMPMSVARREALLACALAIGAIVIEDDYDSEFRYEGRPTDSLQSMDRHGIVTFVGSFSKLMLPELRTGYLVAPPTLLNALLNAKHLSDWHSARWCRPPPASISRRAPPGRSTSPSSSGWRGAPTSACTRWPTSMPMRRRSRDYFSATARSTRSISSPRCCACARSCCRWGDGAQAGGILRKPTPSRFQALMVLIAIVTSTISLGVSSAASCS